jgi:oxalate decarboxylase/phosphoglucose isomerase-like protein (cupin superfamily)
VADFRSFTDSHMRLEEGGWARETTVRELPTSKELAGVNMRLGRGVYRELHWHNEAEWAYIIKVGAFQQFSSFTCTCD